MRKHHLLQSITLKIILFLAAYLMVAALPQLALAQWDSNSESRRRVPRWINESGVYVLNSDLVIDSGDGVRITAPSVTLDLNGYQITTRGRGTGRGIFVDSVSGVTIKNGRVGGFLSNVMVTNTTNVTVQNLQIVGLDLAPNNGPSEIGIQLVNTRAALIKGNTISSTNLGIFVRGGGSTGNRITENTLVGGANPANGLLGICYNPAPNSGTAGPRGDLIYNNHIARFGYAFAISEFSLFNVIRDNTFASYIAGIRETQLLRGNGGTNVAADNIDVIIPATTL